MAIFIYPCWSFPFRVVRIPSGADRLPSIRLPQVPHQSLENLQRKIPPSWINLEMDIHTWIFIDIWISISNLVYVRMVFQCFSWHPMDPWLRSCNMLEQYLDDREIYGGVASEIDDDIWLVVTGT